MELVEDARLRLRRRRRRRCAVRLVAVRLLVDVNDRLALQDVQDDVEALELCRWNDDLAKVEVCREVRGEQLRGERLDELHELLGAVAAVCGREPPHLLDVRAVGKER